MTQTHANPVRWSDIRRDMTPTERFFACCMSRGLPCRLGGAVPETANDKNSIRGEVIRFFAYGGDKSHSILGAKILLRGAWIEGELDLSFARIPYALLFYRCNFASVVNVERAECPALYMTGSRLAKELKGDGLRTRGGVFMRKGFSAERKVRLLGADIGGNLNCIGGAFSGSRGSLIASHARVRGGVFLGRKFSAKGGVRLVGAEIGGNLNCSDGTFSDKDGRALSMSRIKVGGDIFLDRGFFADGEVRMRGASIKGQLDCAGGRFHNPGDEGQHGQRKYALNAEHVRTGRHVYLNKRTPEGEDEPFVADGRVRFANADIGGNFNCKGGQFRHGGERSALAAGGLKSRGAVFLSDGFSSAGAVALNVARIGNFVCTKCKSDGANPITINLESTKAVAVDDDEDAWEAFEFLLDDFVYDTFYGRSPTDSGRRLKWLGKRPQKRRLKNGEEADVPFSPLPYEQAAKVLFGMGRPVDAWDILREKRKLERERDKAPWWRRAAGKVIDTLTDFVFRPLRTVKWTAGIVLAGAVLFGAADHCERMVPHQPIVLAKAGYQEARNAGEHPFQAARAAVPDYPGFNPLAFSLDVFIPLFNLHQEPYWAPEPGGDDFVRWLTRKGEGEFEGWWLLTAWYWLEIMAGWLLSSLLLLSVTGLLRPRIGGSD